ncbi:MAG: OprD family outer membrane porin [Sulfurimonas sp.]
MNCIIKIGVVSLIAGVTCVSADDTIIKSLSSLDNATQGNNEDSVAVKERTEKLEQGGLIHDKGPGRFEIVKKLPEKADTFDEMFDYADAYGKLKLAFIDSAHKVSATPDKKEKIATAAGGEVGINTAEFYGFGLHLSTYISQSVGFLNPSQDEINEDFFNINKNSFAYIAESSLNYNNELINAKVGRVKVETPYANSDDIRMASNTFEGAWASLNYTSELQSQVLFVNRWAGYDSQDDITESQDKFKNLVNENSFGMVAISLAYKYDKDGELSFWYNYIDEMSAIAYAEIAGIYFINGDGFHIDYGFQASNIQDLRSSGVAGNVFGTMLLLHYNGVYFGGAYNIALVENGKYVTNGFGGGPYYTSLDEATIAAISQASLQDSGAFRFATGYDFANVGIDGMSFEIAYGEGFSDVFRVKEKDLILTYEVSDKLYVEAIYAVYTSSNNINDFDRVLVRAAYSF